MATYPGTSTGVRWGVDYDTGEGNLWAAIGNLAKTAMSIELQRNAMQAEYDLQDSILKAEQEMLDLSNRLRDNPDETTYMGELDKTIARLPSLAGKNKLGAQLYDKWIKEQTPAWRETVNEAIDRRIYNKWGEEEALLRAQAIETGSLTKLRAKHAVGRALGRIGDAESELILTETARLAELTAAKRFAQRDPQGALKAIKADKMEGFVLLTPDDIDAVIGTANRRVNEDKKALEAAQDEAGRKMIVDLWNGDLTDLQDVTDALGKNLITPTMAKYLRESILSPKEATPTEALVAETEVRNAIDRYQQQEITKVDALEVLYKNADYVGKEKGSTLLNKIYEDVDKGLAEMKREGKSLMEEYIRTKEPISGLFSDNKQEIMMTAEAQLLLDLAIERAEKDGKPMKRRDIMIEAMRIGFAQREKLDKMTQEQVVPVPSHLGKQGGQRIRSPETVPLAETLGLQEIWDDLTKEDKQKAVNLMAQGATAAQLIAHYRRKQQ